jgi:FkbH-like protein
MNKSASVFSDDERDPKYIKCVVWDLDNTLWHGVLLEDERVTVRETLPSIIRALDSRGILQSIASKNDPETAIQKLQELNLQDYFLYPQIGWSSKAVYIKAIASSLNIGTDAIALIDDQPFEREEVLNSLPEVFCIDAADIDALLDMPELKPRFITSDSRLRRQLYINDMERNQVEEDFVGPTEEFLASLGMQFDIFPATEEDLKRAEELTVRTNQLNTTGYAYSYDELNNFRQSKQHMLFMAKLADKFGSYGNIGLALITKKPGEWTIKLLLMSCRVMSRGVGTIMLNHVMQLAKRESVILRAEFIPNGRNRMMEITYRLAGFEQAAQMDDLLILENPLRQWQSFPDYVEVRIHG